jgi:hypothetical protein
MWLEAGIGREWQHSGRGRQRAARSGTRTRPGTMQDTWLRIAWSPESGKKLVASAAESPASPPLSSVHSPTPPTPAASAPRPAPAPRVLLLCPARAVVLAGKVPCRELGGEAPPLWAPSLTLDAAWACALVCGLGAVLVLAAAVGAGVRCGGARALSSSSACVVV